MKFLAIPFFAAAIPTLGAAASHHLDNGLVTAEFDDRGLTSLRVAGVPQSLPLGGDSAAIKVDGQTLAVPGLPLAETQAAQESLTYRYNAGDRELRVVYQLKPGWRFVSKQLVLTLPAGSTARIESVDAFRATLGTPVGHEIPGSRATGAVFLRLGDSTTTAFLALQNPYLEWRRNDRQVALAYTPDLAWHADDGPFESDRVCIGLCARSGVKFPLRNLAEWKYVPDPDRAFDGIPTLDLAESEAMRQCVSAFSLYHPDKSIRIHVPWCENDYQIDVATAEGRTEWKRIIDQCAAIGVHHTLFTPVNSVVAPASENADAWGWEACLFLGLGQQIRKGEWDIAKDPIPPSIQEMLDYAKSKNVKLVAYAYPTLGWQQNPEWTAWCGGKTGGYVGVDTGVRSFQDWFLDTLVAFHRRTGISGYSFDHWWIAYEPTSEGHKPTSKYAQWAGCRRIIEELRRRIPDVIIDGRQQYQHFGPWTWLGGTYPHPSTHDEQPGSFENFPDLHFSRVSSNRQRWATWYFHMEHFTPWEIVPGYMTHQTPRNDANNHCVRDRPFHTRDWDLLGWKHSVIASIGTAPFNHVVDLLPARDLVEFEHFRREDRDWLRGWMEWTDVHRELLKQLRPVIGPPALGRIDGTAAIDGDHGFVFLFNPNYRELDARLPLDASIGLTAGESFVLREHYPRAGVLHGHPAGGPWRRGETASLPIKGPDARVFEIVPADKLPRPALLGSPGGVRLEGTTLQLSNLSGPSGRNMPLAVLLPPGRKADQALVGGRELGRVEMRGDTACLEVRFAGDRVDHCQQVGQIDATFAGTTYRAELRVPGQVFRQLEARRRAWPVAYTEEELLATWRGSHRLLLFPQIADPNDAWQVGIRIDGKEIEVRRAYSDVFPLGRERTFTGFYADISQLAPDKPHQVEVTLPPNLQPGQFQGLFLENVETEFSSQLAD